jgi:hypothetical protein
MRRWSEREYETLFRDHPPTEPLAPIMDECVAIGRSLGRTPKGIRSQWDDGRSLVLGHANDAAGGLRAYLVRCGWL